jgi:hypothetical protein
MARPGFAPRPDVAVRRTRVLALRTEQVPYGAIAAELGIPESTARSDYRLALEQARTERDEQARLTITAELAKLDALERAAWQVLRARHITVQHGKIVRGEDGEPVLDDAPTLNAIDRILKIAERRARLLGLDAPMRSKIEVTDALDAEIEQLVAELARPAAGGEAAAAGPPGGSGLGEAPA